MAFAYSADERRNRMRRLDDCLETLEREHERGRTRVSAPLARILGERVAGIRAGMLIVDAIDEVLLEQKPLMADSVDGSRGLRPRRSYLPRDKRDSFFEDEEAAAAAAAVEFQQLAESA